jgi:uncharacterized protein (UPF0335 family)
MADVGHNGQLRSIVERIERLEEEKAATASDISDVYKEAKGNGFDVKALRAVIRLRKIDAQTRREQEAILETYMHALGMLADLPLGKAAINRDFADTKVTISSGDSKVETTAGAIQRAADSLR